MNNIQHIVNSQGFNQPIYQHCNYGNVNAPILDSNYNAPILDSDYIAKEFISEYYKNVSKNGWNVIGYLFNSKCTTYFRENHIGNHHNLLACLSEEYIKRANYNIVSSKWKVISNDTILINIFGKIQFVSFIGIHGIPFTFSDTFILKIDDPKSISCHTHFFDIL
jgi:hypothetical protein